MWTSWIIRVPFFPGIINYNYRPHKQKRVSERVLRRAMNIIRSETLGRRLASAKSLAKSLAESLTKSLAETIGESAKSLPRVSDQIICMALRKTLSETRCFYAGVIKSNYMKKKTTYTLAERIKVETPVRNPRPLCNRLNLPFNFTKTVSKISS